MDLGSKSELLYGVNATILIAHEIDSAYWHEWQLFNLPGGIQLYVLLHLLLLPLVLVGYREIVRRGRYARQVSLGLASVGLFTALLHGAFILSGNSLFSLPVSQLLMLATFLVSAYQFSISMHA